MPQPAPVRQEGLPHAKEDELNCVGINPRPGASRGSTEYLVLHPRLHRDAVPVKRVQQNYGVIGIVPVFPSGSQNPHSIVSKEKSTFVAQLKLRALDIMKALTIWASWCCERGSSAQPEMILACEKLQKSFSASTGPGA